MRKCPNCQSDVADDDQFCTACGQEMTDAAALPAADANATAADSDPTAITNVPDANPNSGPAIATLTYGEKNIPLYEGSKTLIAHQGTDKCTPDLAIDSESVSSTPIEVTVENGQITVRDTGTSNGTRVVTYLPPGESMRAKPGDMIMLGTVLVHIG